jgi:hypothetical protein
VPIASGANSVASALGNRTRRDPDAAVRTYHEGLKPARKRGTFYLAGERNFLLGPDRWRRPNTPRRRIAAPTIGATQNSHNCSIAHPPTNTAGAVLRAGLTDRFVTGIPIR